jgi:hypothetical protein
MKSFGYVGNTVFQLDKLMSSDSFKIHGKTLYLADYPPIELSVLANCIQKTLGTRKIRRMPVGLLMLIAKLGDAAKYCGMKNPPLTTFRLNNLLTEMVYDLDSLHEIVGNLPFSFEDGVKTTVEWMRK